MTEYPLIALGEILEEDRDEVAVDPLSAYEMTGVLSFGRGLFRRDSVAGSQTSYSKFTRLHADQVVYSRLFAWEGAVAVVPESFEGTFVSQEFPTFNIRRDRAVPKYLDLVCRWPSFHERLAGLTKGLGLRRQRVHTENFLSIEVPLPDVEEQVRVVSKLDKLFARLRVAQSKVDIAGGSVGGLAAAALGATFDRLTEDGDRPLGEIASVFRGRGPTYLLETGSLAINQACVRWEGLDMLRAREVDPGWAASLPSDLHTSERDVLVNSTGEGTLGRACVVSQEGSGYPFDSHVLAVRTDHTQLLPEFLAAYLRSPKGQLAVEMAKGANTTKQTELGKRKLENIRVPSQPVSEQEKIIGRLDTLLHRISSLHEATVSRAKQLRALGISILNAAFSGRLSS